MWFFFFFLQCLQLQQTVGGNTCHRSRYTKEEESVFVMITMLYTVITVYLTELPTKREFVVETVCEFANRDWLLSMNDGQNTVHKIYDKKKEKEKKRKHVLPHCKMRLKYCCWWQSKILVFQHCWYSELWLYCLTRFLKFSFNARGNCLLPVLHAKYGMCGTSEQHFFVLQFAMHATFSITLCVLFMCLCFLQP